MSSSFPSGDTPEKFFLVRIIFQFNFSLFHPDIDIFLLDLDESLFNHNEQQREDSIAKKIFDKKKCSEKKQNLL